MIVSRPVLNQVDRGEDIPPRLYSVLLAGALALLFPGVLAGFNTFFYRDFGVLAYPSVFYAKTSLWHGQVPLWNPNSNCGAPFLAQWGTMVLYPFAIIYYLFPLPWSLNFFGLLHLFWAGLGMYRLAGRWVGDRYSAALAGFGFVFNGVVLSSLMWPNYVVALGWMPWVVHLVDGLQEDSPVKAAGRELGAAPVALPKPQLAGPRPIVLAALASAMQLLAGVPEIVLLTWLIILAFWVGRLRNGTESRRSLVGRLALVLVLASGLIAAQLLPFLDLLAHSQRSAASATLKWALPPWGLGNFLLPMFRCARSSQGIFFQLGEDFFASTYLGIVVLALGLFALFVRGQRRVGVLAALSLLGIVLALGDYSLAYRAVRHVIPFVGFVRYPVKFLVLPAFALPLMAAYGVKALGSTRLSSVLNVWRRYLCVVLGLLAGVAIVLCLSYRYPSPYDQWPVIWRSAAWRAVLLLGGLGMGGLIRFHAAQVWVLGGRIALLGLIMADALIGTPQMNPVLPASVLTPGLWALQNKMPPPHFGEGRVMISPSAEAHLLISGVRDLESDFIGKRLALWSNLNLLEDACKVNGSSTLQIREEKEIESLLYGSTNSAPPSLIRFLNVTYSTAPGQIIEWEPRPDALPLITAGQSPVFANPRETLRALGDPKFDPVRTVYLPQEAQAFMNSGDSSDARITHARFAPGEIECEVGSSARTMLVIAQSYYHPWHAYVDGARTRLWRANYAFQALEVPAGAHRVQLIYEDREFQIGISLSILTLLICAGLWWNGLWPAAVASGNQ